MEIFISTSFLRYSGLYQHFPRYGQHVKTFTDYDARDLLRLAKDDLIQMVFPDPKRDNKSAVTSQVGLVDGVRLHNDLHMRPVSPRLILYLAQRGETVFSPVLLLEVTVAELIASVAELLQVSFFSISFSP